MANKTSDFSLETLDPLDFVKMLPTRRAIIDNASDSPLPKEYAMNSLAGILHPKAQNLLVAKVTEHSGAKSFELVPDPSRGTSSCAYFSAGQYLCVHLTIGDAKLSKPYSICSSPKQALEGKYVLTVKNTDSGFASDYILSTWKPGSAVTVSAPEGEFRYEPLRDAPHIVGLAGGSGITPFHSLACAIADGDEDCSLTLLYGSRTSENILLRNEFDELANRCDKIKIVHVLSHDASEGYEHGFLTAELINKYAPQGKYSVFLCGPQAMYDFADKELGKLKLERKWIRRELFGTVKHPECNADYPKEVSGKIFSLTVELRGEKRVIPAVAGETLLVAMERAGIAAPSRCRSGECGFCHSLLKSGDVFIPSTVDGRRLADIKFGWIHPCCCFPTSDVALEISAE